MPAYGAKRGEEHYEAKLTADDVREIRRRHGDGEGPSTIADDYPVTVDAIYGVITRRTWKHVE